MYDIIIIGAGPAGLTAAIYALRANKKIKIFEKETIGGHITSSPMVSNYPGFKNVPGLKIADSLYDQIEDLGGEIEFESVEKIENGDVKKVITDYGTYETKSVIIATGTNYRMLGLENEEKFIGNGISFCVTCDGAFYKDKEVGVVGGSNSAIVEALELSKICKKVYMFVRKDMLTGEKIDIDKIEKSNNIEIYYNSQITKIIGDEELKEVEYTKDSNLNNLKLDGLFLAIGQLPNINIIDNVDKDNKGYVLSNEECTTNLDGIFVAGDVKSKKIRQLTTATSDGTIAAISAIEYLENWK